MALNAYLSLKGESHGHINGSVTQAGREDLIEVIAVNHEVLTPRDAASGLPTGKRQHKPITITKDVDKSSPLLYRALAENELLRLFPNLAVRYFRDEGYLGDLDQGDRNRSVLVAQRVVEKLC